MKAVKIAIRSDRGNIQRYKTELERKNFHYDGIKYTKTCHTKKEISWAKDFCRNNRLIFFYDNEYGERSKNYRSTYFQNNQPDRRGRYQCVYCGKKLRPGHLTIDHLYPVSVVSKDLKLQKKLKKHGIESLNSKENLVCACWNCNQKKGTQMGRWILKGKLGRHKGIWKIRKGFRVLLILFGCYLIFCLALAIQSRSAEHFLEQPITLIKETIQEHNNTGE